MGLGLGAVGPALEPGQFEVDLLDLGLAQRYLAVLALQQWVALGQRYGIQSPKGYGIEEWLNKVVEHTPHAIATVQRKLPLNFPQTVSEPIFAGLQQAAMRLAESQP